MSQLVCVLQVPTRGELLTPGDGSSWPPKNLVFLLSLGDQLCRCDMLAAGLAVLGHDYVDARGLTLTTLGTGKKYSPKKRKQCEFDRERKQ